MIARTRRPRLDPDAILPWLCVIAVTGRMAAVAIAFPPFDGDRFWQRWLGERILREHAIPRALGPETFAAAGAPWTPQEWLFSIALAFGADRGLPWLVPLACALAAGLALAIVALRCGRRGLSGALNAAAVVLCGLAMIQSFGVRAQVFGWAGLALVLWFLEAEGPIVWLAVPVTIVWANLHASVFLAPCTAALFALGALLRDRGWSPALRRYAAVTGGCALATFFTPLGLDLPRYAAGLLASPIRASISEWGATSTSSAAFALGALPLVLLLVAFGVRVALDDRIVAAAFTVLLFTAVRNVPVFAIATAPIALAAIPPRGVMGAAARTTAERFAAWTTVAAVLFMAVAIPALSWRAAPRAADALPIVPMRALLAQRSAPRVFCEDFSWCSILLATGKGHARFFMDGRCDPYPPRLWREYRTVIDGNSGWKKILDARHVDAVLVRRNGALDNLLAEQAGNWRAIASDGRARVYVREPLEDRSQRRVVKS